MRRTITVILGILLVVAGILIANSLANTEKPALAVIKKVIPTVFTEKVENRNVQITVVESGRLLAKNRIELYAEVQGIMEATNKEFKPGTEYKKGELLVRIRSNDYRANLQAQKSTLQNLITSILPDLRLDFPEAYKKWDAYIRNFDMDKPIENLPKPTSEKEKFFVTGKNIYTTYYTTKNMEIILSKYRLRAPYKGILTDALVTQGSLVRQGQKLGEYIDPTVFELEVSVSKSLMSMLEKGKKVQITDFDNSDGIWYGIIKRINGKVNQSTQTVRVFIELKGTDLKEGMFLEAHMEGRREQNAYEIPRNLLVDESNVFVVRENVLELTPIEPVFFNQKSVVIRGLKDGDILVSKPVPGAYSGMEVELYDKAQ